MPALRGVVLIAVLGYGLLGLIDDCLAVGEDRGFRGHLRAFREGRLTSGMLKLLGGGAIAILLVSLPSFPRGRTLLLDGALVALCANVGNVFDRAPARTIKVGVLGFIPVVLVLQGAAGPIAVVIGAALAMIPEERSEKAMLGDTGANPIGAAIGIGLVFGASTTVRILALVVVVVINLAAERWSFSSVIERNGLLRALDGVGQSPTRQRWARDPWNSESGRLTFRSLSNPEGTITGKICSFIPNCSEFIWKFVD